MVYTSCREASGWRADYASMFVPHLYAFICTNERTCRTSQSRSSSSPNLHGNLLNLGTLKEAFETRLRSVPFFDFSSSGQDTQGQVKVFSAQFGSLVFLRYERWFASRTWIARSLLGNYTLFPQAGWTATGCDKASPIEVLSDTVERPLRRPHSTAGKAASVWEQIRQMGQTVCNSK